MSQLGDSIVRREKTYRFFVSAAARHFLIILLLLSPVIRILRRQGWLGFHKPHIAARTTIHESGTQESAHRQILEEQGSIS